jgi:hypothetical protein
MREHEQRPPTDDRSIRLEPDVDNSEVVARAAAAATAGRQVPPEAVLLLQRAAGNAAVASTLGDTVDGTLVHSVVGQGGGGEPLEPTLRQAMESSLGADLSDVRVHTDARASRSAQDVQADAYTAGNHVVFQRQQYQPDTDAGLHMLAHELTHVVQQRTGPVDGTPAPGGISLSDPGDPFEQAAERSAARIVRSVGGVGGIAALRREDDEPSS